MASEFLVRLGWFFAIPAAYIKFTTLDIAMQEPKWPLAAHMFLKALVDGIKMPAKLALVTALHARSCGWWRIARRNAQ
jgi:hypothetical protein